METRTYIHEDITVKYFMSDPHFDHVNICCGVSKWNDKSSCRDFDTVAEMNNAILSSINSFVKTHDELWILGDFAFGDKNKIPYWRSLIRCNNVNLIYGNHDKHIRQSYELRSLFHSCKDYDEIHIKDSDGNKHGLILFHYYIGGVWNKAGRGYYHLFGHSHNSLPRECIRGKCFDIVWDAWHKPLSEYEVCQEMVSRDEFEQIDHHGEKTVYF